MYMDMEIYMYIYVKIMIYKNIEISVTCMHSYTIITWTLDRFYKATKHHRKKLKL